MKKILIGLLIISLGLGGIGIILLRLSLGSITGDAAIDSILFILIQGLFKMALIGLSIISAISAVYFFSIKLIRIMKGKNKKNTIAEVNLLNVQEDVPKNLKIEDVKKERTFEDEKKFKKNSARTYYTKKAMLWDSNPEKDIFNLIKTINPEELIVLPHVSLKEIFKVKEENEHKDNREKYLRSFHVDFLICSAIHLIPIIGIELDGAYHNNKEQQLRDTFKNEIFKSNNIPLIRIRYSEYTSGILLEKIRNELNKAPIYCKECGAEMVFRQGTEGRDNFLGCKNYRSTGCTYKRNKEFKYIG